jgi:hypothetical protein
MDERSFKSDRIDANVWDIGDNDADRFTVKR